MMVKDYPINSIEVARLRDENYTLEQQNADLVAALDELLKSQKALMQNNNLDNLELYTRFKTALAKKICVPSK